ncbi:MAG: SHOCT domain-containing protein [Eubacteriales bacterium]
MFINGVPVMEPWTWIWWLIGVLISVAIICAIVRVIIRAVRGESWHHHHHHHNWDYWVGQDDPSREARRILDERYAKGEINDEEYKRKKENMK